MSDPQAKPPTSPQTSSPEESAWSFPSSSSSGEYGAASPSASGCNQQDNAAMCHDDHTPSLATFLHRDIHPQEGHRLLLPFLTTMDRLRLSECSQDLMDYRYSLSRVKVVHHPSPTPGNKRGLVRLLSEQNLNQVGCLEYLHVGHESHLHVLDLVSEGCFKGLKTLDLSQDSEDYGSCEEGWQVVLFDEDSLGYVTRALGGGGLRGLEELNLRRCPIGDDGIGAIMSLLKAGVCPLLRRLIVSSGHAWDSVGYLWAAEALQAGRLHHLEELDLSYVILSPSSVPAMARVGGAAIARALQGGACPRLVKLHLPGCNLSREDGRALGDAMRSGSCAKLEDLNLRENELVGDDGFMAIFGALEAGSCPSLKRLDIGVADLSIQSATAFGHALRSGNCLHLQWLNINDSFSAGAALRVLQDIQQGMPDLLHLDIYRTGLHQEHGQVVGEAIAGGALPKLEELRMGENMSLDDGGAVPIMVGLEGGGCSHLRELEVGDIKMGPQGGHALARALASGHLGLLQRIDVSWNKDLGDETMAEVIKGLRKCHQLHSLRVVGTGIGIGAGQALVQALQDRAWPDLEVLAVSYNVPIMLGLEEGVCRHLKELRVYKMGPQEDHIVARALASGSLSCLQRLDVDDRDFGDEAMAEVIKGVRKCHQLRWLGTQGTGMGVMAGQALVQALQDKVWPDLKVISASYNEHLLSDERVPMSLAEVLENTGLCPRLEVVDVRWSGLNRKGEAGGRLARLLALEEAE